MIKMQKVTDGGNPGPTYTSTSQPLYLSLKKQNWSRGSQTSEIFTVRCLFTRGQGLWTHKNLNNILA